MSTGDGDTPQPSRLWWAAPLALAVVTAAVVMAFVLPTLAGGASVPAQLVVHRSPAPASPSPTASHSRSPSATPRPTQSTVSAQPSRSTTVVPPQQPVVRESDDRHDDGGQGSGGRNDR